VTDCKCNAGYTGPDGSSICSMCDAGKYKDTSGSAACVLCPNATYSSFFARVSQDTCQPCYNDSTSNKVGGLLFSYAEALSIMVCFVKALVNTILPPVLDMLLQGSRDIYDCLCNAGYEVLAHHWLRDHRMAVCGSALSLAYPKLICSWRCNTI
jgi:hypothetical protein